MTTTTPTYADILAGVQTAIASYGHALDDARIDDVVGTFCADGVFEIPAAGTRAEGLHELSKNFAGFASTAPQRHVVVNTQLTEWGEEQAYALSDLLVIHKADGRWAIQFVGRYDDHLRNQDGLWKFSRRTLTFVG